MNADDKILLELLGKDIFDELQNQLKASAGDDKNFLLELKTAFVKDIKSIDLI